MGNINRKRIISTAGSGSGGSGGSTPTNTTYAALSTSITANTATEGFYLINDRADAGILVQVFNDANGINQIRLEAEGVFYNPDFQAVGDYSGITGFGTQLGVWHSALLPAADDVVIWDGIHYRNITGAVGTDPSADAVNWDDRPKTSNPLTNGYIEETNFILYDFANDSILYREDSRGNHVTVASITTFQFGNDLTLNWKLSQGCVVNNINSRSSSSQSNEIFDNVQLVINNEFTPQFTGNKLYSSTPGSVIYTFNNTSAANFNGNFINLKESKTFSYSQAFLNQILISDISPATKTFLYNNFS